MAAFPGFVDALLAAMKAPNTPQNRLFLQAWQRAEGGSASNNPFNTTQGEPGATNYNGVGVKNYGSPSQGAMATVQTLLNGRYGNIVSDLRSGQASARRLASDVASSPWGTGSGVLRVLGVSGGAGGSAGGSSGPSVSLGGSGGPSSFNQLLSSYLLSQAQQQLSGGDAAGFGSGGLLQLALARKALTAAATNPATNGRVLASAKAAKVSGFPDQPGTSAGGFLPSGAAYHPGRLDQGHDFQTNPGAPIVAPGDGVVTAVKSDPSGFGPAYPIVHFTSGPYAGKDIYIGHTISQLQPGQKFSAGTVLSLTGKTPIGNAQVPGWAEIGFAPGGLPGPDGQAVPFS